MNINVPTIPPKSGNTHSKNTSFTFMAVRNKVSNPAAGMQRLSDLGAPLNTTPALVYHSSMGQSDVFD